MALAINEIKVRMSGGAANGTASLSLGGIRSTTAAGEVISQVTSSPTNVTGVTIDNAYSNGIGAGTLKWNPSNSMLTWKGPGATNDVGEEILANGVYTLGDSSGFLTVTVDLALLPGTVQQDAGILVDNKLSNVFDAVSSQEATDGLVEYRCLYIYNSNDTDTAYDVRIWVKQQPTGPDHIDIALEDPVVVGDGQTVGVAIGPLADEEDSTDLLAALTFTRPSNQQSGLLLGNLTPLTGVAFWERRTVDAETIQQEPNDNSRIGISALI